MLLQSILAFLGETTDNFEWPFTKRPMDLSKEVLLSINVFALRILQTMLDREGSQKPG